MRRLRGLGNDGGDLDCCTALSNYRINWAISASLLGLIAVVFLALYPEKVEPGPAGS